METEIKVSVIIPVYNAESYLRQSLDSIKGQTLEEIEIICVDDGSTDHSLKILQEYAAADPRFQILTQKNQYAGVARNYVIFWDSDDYFDLDALRLMYERAEETNADVCICNAQDFDSETGTFLAHSYLRKPYPETEVFNIRDCKDQIYNFTSTVTWNKLTRRQFMLDENITFQAQQHINDVLASMLVLSLAERITVCDKRLIFYRMNRSGSLMSSYGEKIDSVMTAYEETYRRLEERGLTKDPLIRQSIVDKAVGVYFFTMPYVDNVEQFREYFRRMTTEDHFLKNGLENLNHEFNMTRYLSMKDMNADSFLFSEYQRLTRTVYEKRQEISGQKKELMLAGKEHDKTKAKLDRTQEKLQESRDKQKALKEELKAVRKELNASNKELKQIKEGRAYKLALKLKKLAGRG